MKKHMKLIPVLCALMLAAACSKEDVRAVPDNANELVLAPSVDDGTRAINYNAEKYLTLSGYEKADVTVGVSTVTYDYDDTDKVLKADGSTTPFTFPGGNNTLTFLVEWPTAAQREAIMANFPKDQSDPGDFFSADFLSVKKTAYYSSKVLINLEHEHCKAAFTLEGTSFYGKKIEKLYFNGYSAYCDPNFKDAQLIFPPLDAYMVFQAGKTGVVKVEGDEAMYTFTLASQVTGFNKGTHHTIKLNVIN